MSTIYRRRTQLSLFGVLAMAALLAVLLAVTLTAGPTQAQTGIDPVDPRTGDNEDFYDEPHPCSEEAQPDANTVSIISEGYYAVFDAFWDYEVGHLSDNFCPPEVTVTTETHTDEETGEETTVTVYDRSDANIHISETAFSIPDSYKVTVIDSRPSTVNGTSSKVTGETIDLADYPFLREAVSAVKPGPDSTAENPTTVFANNTVYWVRLDEPGTTADETSPLKIGFSTALMKDGDWHNPNGNPVQFHFGAVHVVGANFFAFDQRETDTPLTNSKWSNIETATEGKIDMAVGEYRPMQLLFTQPGEYLVQARIQAHVRREAPAGSDPNWEPINPGDSITSPAEWYTFYVGPLTLNQDPVFGIERAVPENSAAGVAAGRAAPVLDEDAGDTHTFNLTGGGADKFILSATGDGVQIAVADGAVLNYEDRQSYDLTLQVSDGKDRFSHVDASVDDTIPVRIVVEDDPNEQLAVTLEADRTTQTIGQGVRLTARVHNSPVSSGRLSYRHHEQNVGGGMSLTELTQYTTRTVTWDGAPVSREYTMTVWVTDGGTNAPQVTSNRVVIDWTN